MQNTSLSFLQILSIAALVAASACSGELRRPESAVAEAVPGGFVVPDGWSFPPGQVVPTYGAEGMVSTTDRVASEMGVEGLSRGGQRGRRGSGDPLRARGGQPGGGQHWRRRLHGRPYGRPADGRARFP